MVFVPGVFFVRPFKLKSIRIFTFIRQNVMQDKC